jgi:hypothetical protein
LAIVFAGERTGILESTARIYTALIIAHVFFVAALLVPYFVAMGPGNIS